MEWIYITFRSITYAQRGKKLLEGNGLSCHMTRAARWMEEKGCSYALKLEKKQGERAIRLLDENEIPWKARYGSDREGRVQRL